MSTFSVSESCVVYMCVLLLMCACVRMYVCIYVCARAYIFIPSSPQNTTTQRAPKGERLHIVCASFLLQLQLRFSGGAVCLGVFLHPSLINFTERRGCWLSATAPPHTMYQLIKGETNSWISRTDFSRKYWWWDTKLVKRIGDTRTWTRILCAKQKFKR